jgi:hypothetical protein
VRVSMRFIVVRAVRHVIREEHLCAAAQFKGLSLTASLQHPFTMG